MKENLIVWPSRALVLGLTLLFFCRMQAAQETISLRNITIPLTPTQALPLKPSARAALSADLRKRNYADAERILIDAIHRCPRSFSLLTFLGGIYFLAGSYLESAVAMKKAEQVSSLPDPDRFTLAMAYILLGHSDWAQPEVERLIRREPGNALFYYWLSRIDYDRRFYAQGVAAGRTAINLKPDFVRAFDSVGLCEEALGHYDEAIKAYTKAAELNVRAVPPSPWPPLELGALLLRLNHFSKAKREIEKALSIDPSFPEAHYRLGIILEHEGDNRAAEVEYQRAISLKPDFAGPHYALARLYHRLGENKKSSTEAAIFENIRSKQREMGIR